MNKNELNNKIDHLSCQATDYVDKSEGKASELISKIHNNSINLIENTKEMAIDMVEKSNEMIDKGSNMINDKMDEMNSMMHEKVEDIKEMSQDMMEMSQDMKMDMYSKMMDDPSNYENQTDEMNTTKSHKENALQYIKEYAMQHPVITTTAVSATVLAGASLIIPSTRKISKPIAKYALKQQGKLALGVGMLALATVLTNQDSNMNNTPKF